MNNEIVQEQPDLLKQLKKDFSVLNANSFQGRLDEYKSNGTPVVAGTDDFFPELFTAMETPFYFMVRQGLEYGFHAGRGPELVDGYNDLSGSSSLCSLQKSAAYLLMTGQLIKPAAVVMTSTSCDGQNAVNELMSNFDRWADVPKISFDASFEKDEASMAYLGRQWMNFIPLLEKISGKKLDLDRLREVCEESNRQSMLCFELQELRRARPSPIRADWGFIAYMVARWSTCGRPEGTDWLQRLFDYTEQRVKNNQGIDGVPEKIRYAWFDILPTWSEKLFPVLEQKYKAVNLMDLYGYAAPWPVIDTSSLETIFISFAKRFLIGNPMTRQIFALSDVYGGDAVHIARNFSCDAMIMPSHVGHKDGSASHRIVKDMFREIGIPFLVVGCDVFDERYMTADVVINKIGTFFETTGLT
jgi:benzoyl-CoA reductase subunit B